MAAREPLTPAAYRDATGTMDLHARDAQGTAYDFTFHLDGNHR